MRWILLALGLTVLATSGTVSAHEIKHKSVRIVHPWVSETSGQEAVLRATLKNGAQASERLIAASTAVATKVVIVDAQGKELPSVAIPARGELALKTDGPRVLLSGLKKPLQAYDSFDVTLVFEKAGEVKVEVVVEEAPSQKPGRQGKPQSGG